MNLKTSTGKVHMGYRSIYGWTAECNENIREDYNYCITEEDVTCKTCLKILKKYKETCLNNSIEEDNP